MLTCLTIAFAAILCTLIHQFSKWYVDNYCQDNPEIVWIWLDGEDTCSGHHIRIKTRQDIRSRRYSLTPAGSIALIF